MPRETWRDAVADIDETTGPVTSKQKQLAAVAGIDLPNDLPQLVARVRLRGALVDDLGLQSAAWRSDACSEAQLELISQLKGDDDISIDPASWEEASS